MYKKFTLILLTAVLLISCKKEKTSWDSSFDVPIAFGTIDLKDLITDSILSVNPDQSYQLVLNQDLFAVKIDTLITIPDTSFIEKVALGFPINANPGFEFAQNTKEHHFAMNGAEIKFLRFRKGTVDVTITSPLASVTKYILEIPNASKNGEIFSEEVIVPAGTTNNQSTIFASLDFSGYQGDLRGIDLNSSNKIQTRLIAKIDESGAPITVQTTDTILFNIEFKGLVPDYAQGYFGQQNFDQSTSFSLDALKNITAGQLKLEEVNFDFIIENGIKTTGMASIQTLQSENTSSSTIIDMTHPEIGQDLNINPASGSWSSLVPSQYNIHFDDLNSNAGAFIENLPDSLKIAYSMQLNPFGNISAGTDAFYPDSELKLKINMNMPLALATDSLTYQDTMDFNFQQNFDNSHIYDGSLQLNYKNYFPFTGHLNLTFIDEDGNHLTTISTNEGIIAGQLNGLNIVDTPTSNLININVSHEQIMLMNSAKKMLFNVIFDTPSYPTTVSIYDHYKLDVHLKSTIRATIKF
jgi:hypothetical protein